MLLVTVRNDLAGINQALDEVETTRDPEHRRQRMEQALVASRRVLGDFLRDDDLGTTLRQAREATAPYAEAVSAVVSDSLLFGAFLRAERRLFEDLGLDSSATDRLIAMMRETGPLADGEDWPPARFGELLELLGRDVGVMLERVHVEEVGTEVDAETHAQGRRVLRRVFLVVGGAFVCGANALVGAGAAPVTGGLSIVGAAVSGTIGCGLVGNGLPR